MDYYRILVAVCSPKAHAGLKQNDNTNFKGRNR